MYVIKKFKSKEGGLCHTREGELSGGNCPAGEMSGGELSGGDVLDSIKRGRV